MHYGWCPAWELFQQKRRVGVEVAAQVAREEERLDMGQKPDFDLLAKERVDDGLLLLFLPREKDGLARVIAHFHGAGFGGLEVLGAELLQVDERERHAVGQWRAELLHEIERKAVPARAQGVEESDLRIEADALQRAGAVVRQKRVEERQQGVHRIERRAAVAVLDRERLALGDKKHVEGLEILGGCLALDAAHLVRCSSLAELLHKRRKLNDALGATGFVAVVAQAALENGSRIDDLAGDERRGDVAGLFCVLCGLHLRNAQKDIARNRSLDTREKAPML